MNCYKCATGFDRVTPAVAACSTCGAGACLEHVRVGAAVVHEHTPGNPTLYRLPGRRMYDPVCAPPGSVTWQEAAAGEEPTV
ncbi:MULTISPECIES: DUF2180 family protein [unclassified Isoptericola]|uniref:DUF2180 family protein n=1 Tax=unclassified Isoptericola TaxID=2623355 RepID=UPI00365E49F6